MVRLFRSTNASLAYQAPPLVGGRITTPAVSVSSAAPAWYRLGSRLASLMWIGLLLVVVGFHVAAHRDEGGWIAKADPAFTLGLEGHLVQFEWSHLVETVRLLETGQPPEHFSTQTAYRVTAPYAISLIRELLGGGVYRAALATHVLFWIATAAAMYALTQLATGSKMAGVAAAMLVANSPGFIYFLGNVDVHPSAYAAVAAWWTCLESLRLGDPVAAGQRRWVRCAFAGVFLSVVGHTVEAAYPLLAGTWAYLPARVLLRGGATRDVLRDIRSTLAQLAILTAAFAIPFVGYRLLMEQLLFPQRLHALNDPITLLRESLLALQADSGAWLRARLDTFADRMAVAFPGPTLVFAVVGAALVPRRWLVWACVSAGVYLSAVMLTKPVVRELYCVFPAVYVLAAAGIDRIAAVGAGLGAGLGANSALPARKAVHAALVCVLLASAAAATNADLWGDYYLAVRWWRD